MVRTDGQSFSMFFNASSRFSEWKAFLASINKTASAEVFVPVGHIWTFDLEEHKNTWFWMKFYFSKIRMEPVMLNFLATTENIKYKIRTTKLQLWEKCQIYTVGNCYSQFPS